MARITLIELLLRQLGFAEKYSGSVTVLNVYSKEKIRSRDLLKKAGAFARMRNAKCDAKSEQNENVPGRIIEIARDGAYDLIAIVSRGVGWAKAWLLGSV